MQIERIYYNIANFLFSGLERDKLFIELLRYISQELAVVGAAVYVASGKDEFVKYREYKRAEGKGGFKEKLKLSSSSEVQYFEEYTLISIEIDNNVIGILVLLGIVDSEEILKVLLYVAHIFGLILKRTFLYSVKDQRKLLELAPLYEITKDIAMALEPQKLLNTLIKTLKDVINFDNCMVFLKDETGQKLRLVSSLGIEVDERQAEINIEEDPVIRQVISGNKAILITNIAKKESAEPEFQQKVNSFMAVPLSIGDDVLGTINFAVTGEVGYTEEDVRLINLIAAQIAVLLKISLALSELQIHSQNILRSISSGVITLDKKKQITIKNAAAIKILVIGDKEKERIYSFLDKYELWPKIEEVLTQGKRFEQIQVTYRVNSSTKHLMLNIIPLLSKKNEIEGVIITIDDITRRVLLEREISRNERMTALGHLSAGIAHEIRNPLTAIRGFTQLLPQKYDDPIFRDKFITIMSRETKRLNKIVDDLLSFARPKAPDITLNNLKDTIDRLLTLIQTTARKQGVNIETDLPADLKFYYDENQIEQALINIFLNSLQAMKQGGVLRVSAMKKGNKVIIEVKDTGEGMTEEELKNVFNPFFTTKKEGTGLGLSITHKIITEHQGKIEMFSTPGKGTTTVIQLPYKTKT